VPGLLLLPWWLWVIGVLSIMVPHELMHGLVARTQKIAVRSLGWILLLFLPGAFVEPDEKQLQKSKLMTRLRVYSSGSFANMIVAALALALSVIMVNALFAPYGLAPTALINNSGAYNASLNGTVISIAGTRVFDLDTYNQSLVGKKPGDVVIVESDLGNETKNYSIKLTKSEDNRTILGVYSFQQVLRLNSAIEEKTGEAGADVALMLLNIINWIAILNFSVGAVNLLPIKPLDGGYILQGIVEKRAKNITNAMKIANVISILMFAVLLFNLIGPYIMSWLTAV